MPNKRIIDFYNEIIQIKEGKSELQELAPYNDNGANLMNDLNSESKVAIWRLWVWIIATLTWLQDQAFKKHKNEVKNLIINNTYGTLPFYHDKSLAFQYGYFLIWNGKNYTYSDVNVDAQIITRCSVSMSRGVLVFKVVKGLNDNLQPLDQFEKMAFKDYIGDIIAPGTNYKIVTSAADLLLLNLRIYINPQKLTFEGKDIISGESLVVNNINAFCSDLPFDGRMNLLKLIDQLQIIEGVEDIELIESTYKYGDLDWIDFKRQIIPFSGHMLLDIDNSNISYHEYV